MDFHAALLGLDPSEASTSVGPMPPSKRHQRAQAPVIGDEFHLSLLGLTDTTAERSPDTQVEHTINKNEEWESEGDYAEVATSPASGFDTVSNTSTHKKTALLNRLTAKVAPPSAPPQLPVIKKIAITARPKSTLLPSTARPKSTPRLPAAPPPKEEAPRAERHETSDADEFHNMLLGVDPKAPKVTTSPRPPKTAVALSRYDTPRQSPAVTPRSTPSPAVSSPGLSPSPSRSPSRSLSPPAPPPPPSPPQPSSPAKRSRSTNDAARAALLTNNNVLDYYLRLQNKLHPQVNEDCKQMGSSFIHRVSWTLHGDVFEAAAGAPGKKNAQKEAYRRLLIQVPVDEKDEDQAAVIALINLRKMLNPTISSDGLIWDVPARGMETERFEGVTKAELYATLAPQADRLVKMQKATEVQQTLVEDMRSLLDDDRRKILLCNQIQNHLRPRVETRGDMVAWNFADKDGTQVRIVGVGPTKKDICETILVHLGMVPEQKLPPTMDVKMTGLARLTSFSPAWWWQMPIYELFQQCVKDSNAPRVNQFMEQLVRLSGIAPIPANLWEQLLEEAAYCLRPHEGARMPRQGQGEDSWRAVALLDQLGRMEVEVKSFSSPEALQYFCRHRLMMAYEQWAAVQHVGLEAMGGRDWNCSLATVKYVSETVVTVMGIGEDLSEKDVVVVASKKCSPAANIADPYTMPCPCRVVKTGKEVTIRPLDTFPGSKGDFVKLYSAQTYEIIQRQSLALQALTRSLPFAMDPRATMLAAEYTPTMKRVLIHGDISGESGIEVVTPLTDDAQHDAITAACDDSQPLTLIQGPPGTGKTYVCCAILEAWHKMPHVGKLLAVADTNVAADNIQEGLTRRGVPSLRLGVGGDDELAKEQFRDCSKFVRYVSALQKKDRPALVQLRQEMTAELLKTVDVIIATCVGIGNENYSKITFSKVIVDECTQAVEASSIVALGRRALKVVLVGDHEQLPPTVFCTRAKDMGFDQSLYERMRSQLTPFTLKTQRRMHPEISAFPRHHTYGGAIVDGVTAEERPPIVGVEWPNRVLLVDTSFCENSKGVSKMNSQEAQALLATLRHIINQGGVQPRQIGVLTPYNAQKRILIDAAKDDPLLHGVKVDSVDGFQGKERDLILFSAVRCNNQGQVGFLKDNRRCNVMLTRARRGLIVFGNKETLKRDPIWNKWIEHLAPRHAIIPFAKWKKMNGI
eukprot:GEMP01000546.1.p1 GENE.GEMP01000546.1~~GEMP01000546.1.p1  ORF type:complete len:1199 (-),score=368.52 GEMP01000546.1:698-4294(-)